MCGDRQRYPRSGQSVTDIAGVTTVTSHRSNDGNHLFFRLHTTRSKAPASSASRSRRTPRPTSATLDLLKVRPAATPLVGETEAIAQEKDRALKALVDPHAGLSTLSYHLDVDLSAFPQDSPLPDIDESGVQVHYQEVREATERDQLTLRNLGKRYGSRHEGDFVGTPEKVADGLERWFRGGSCDGYVISCPLPARRLRGLQAPGGAAPAALRAQSHGLRGPDTARQPRPGAPRGRCLTGPVAVVHVEGEGMIALAQPAATSEAPANAEVVRVHAETTATTMRWTSTWSRTQARAPVPRRGHPGRRAAARRTRLLRSGARQRRAGPAVRRTGRRECRTRS